MCITFSVYPQCNDRYLYVPDLKYKIVACMFLYSFHNFMLTRNYLTNKNFVLNIFKRIYDIFFILENSTLGIIQMQEYKRSKGNCTVNRT
jgi:hypothetical protein